MTPLERARARWPGRRILMAWESCRGQVECQTVCFNVAGQLFDGPISVGYGFEL